MMLVSADKQLTISEKHEWMIFVRETVQAQARQMPNLELARAWQMFADSLHAVHAGIGNRDGFISVSDVADLIQVASSGLRFNRAGIGENLLWMEIGGDGELEVTFEDKSVSCSAAQMLGALRQLMLQMQKRLAATAMRAP